jgi:putative membrane protein
VGADGEEHGAGGLLAPVDPVLGPILLAVLGAAVVVILIIVEAKFASSKDEADVTDSSVA